MSWVNVINWSSVGSVRYSGFQKIGTQGDHINPTKYSTIRGNIPPVTFKTGAKNYVDVPSQAMCQWTMEGAARFTSLANASYAKFISNVRGQTASLGISLGEWEESLDMVTRRSLQLYRGYRALRKGEFRKFLRTFGIGPKRKHRNLVRNSISDASNLWLEYSFGWSPCVADIYAACDAMGQPLPGGPVSGSRFQLSTYKVDYSRWKLFNTGRVSVKIGARVYVSNPNLYLVQQMGLANPALIAWELTPLSFLADWVFDVGSFLGSFTDLLGCQVVGPYTTVFYRGSYVADWRWPEVFQGTQTGPLLAMSRVPGLYRPTPNLDFQANIGGSLRRAANAVSLLGQILVH